MRKSIKFLLTGVAIISTLLLSVCQSYAASDRPEVPKELLDYVLSQGCKPLDDFYKRPSMVNPPFVYGFSQGEPKSSAAVWCKRNESSNRPYLLLLKVSDPKQLQGCPNRIEWWNYPKGLSVEAKTALNLSDFHYVDKPKQPGPKTTIDRANLIVSEYDGVEELFVCYQGSWLYKLLD